MSGLLVCVLFSLASLQQIAAAQDNAYLQHETRQTLHSLETLSSHCTQAMDTLILSQQSQLPRQVFQCSVSSIVADLARVLEDTAFFGLDSWVSIHAFLNSLESLKECSEESTAEAQVYCYVANSISMVKAAEVIEVVLKDFPIELKTAIPTLVEDIKQCRESSLSQYKVFLKSVLDKATTCSQ